VAGGVQQGLGFFTQGAQVISSIASLFGGSTGQDVSRVAGQLSVGGSQVGALLQGLQGGRVPSLPGEPVGGAAPMAGTAVGGGQFDATALLQMFMSNPQIQEALQAAPVLGHAAPRTVELVIPTERRPTTVSIPLSAVVSTMAELASRSAVELETGLPEYDTEYLTNKDGEYFVNPEEPESRAGIVLHYFRLAGEAARFGEHDEASLDESEAWAMEAGLY